MLSIEQQIAETDLAATLALFPNAPYEPYSYQLAVYRLIADEIRSFSHPFVVKAAVSAGKTTIISLVATTIQRLNMPAIILSRQGEIVEQDAAEMWNFSVKNSVFCAGLGMKSTANKIITASEKTACNALFKELEHFAPLVMMIDECQHVDVDDYLNSEMRIVRKAYDENGARVPDWKEGDHYDDGWTIQEYTGETYEDMIESGRSQYTILIRTLSERCQRVHGRRMRILGLTGTDFRGVQPIINEDLATPGFWRKAICDISTEYLVKFGAVVPTHFGDTGDLHYDLSGFKSDGAEGEVDYSAEKMRQMQAAIHDQASTTQEIMLDVYHRTLNRNSVLVTCAGKKHCQEAADALPEGVTYCIITDSTPAKVRRQYLKEISEGKIKFTFQIGCLTTGVNIPIWDTGVILRKIGSLTLLVQLIGRTMRKPKQWMIDAGILKKDALILDYSETMEELGELYFNPVLEQYHYEIANNRKEFKHCPVCQKMGKSGKNGEHARRCITEHATRPVNLISRADYPKGYLLRSFKKLRYQYPTERCEYFWKSRVCEDVTDNTGRLIKKGCGTENDVTARNCRSCGGTLIDPNDSLSKKHYTENDYYDVISFSITPSRNQQGIVFSYLLQDPKDGRSFRANEFYHPASDSSICKRLWREACRLHMPNHELANSVGGIKNAIKIMEFVSHFRSPDRTTHRKGKANKDILHRKVFSEVNQ